jgi:uncharacterized protein (DUF1684 family)
VSLTLLDWRRQVAALYGAVRAETAGDPEGALARVRSGRDRLFAGHPETPLAQDARGGFRGLPYWPHDPGLRFDAEMESAPPQRLVVAGSDGEPYPLDRIGRVRLPVGELDVYWIAVYGGGVFLPFRDTTAGRTTYGAGRYLLDTVKGADLGGDDRRLIVDFNYAYHPSCAYDARWSCPLAPRSNWLTVEIEAGERL